MRRSWIVLTIVLGLSLGAVATVIFIRPDQPAWKFISQTIGPKRATRFIVVGDSHGVNPVYTQIIDEIKTGEYAFLLHLADSTEFGTADEFAAVKALESRLPFPVYHTVGNHDIKTDPSRQTFINIFGHGPNTAVQVGEFRLLILDNSDRKVGFSESTLNWLDQEIQAYPSAPYLLAFHRPFDLPLASLFGDDETAASKITNQKFLERIQSIQVAQIFTAHLHTFLRYSLSDIPAVVSGGGGDPAQTILGGPSNNQFHYLIVTLDGQTPQIEVRDIQLTEPGSVPKK